MTNADILDMVPETRRDAVERTFERYCRAFDKAFPLLYPNLFECTANPFLDSERKVDLSGLGQGGPGMGRTISLAFSLPSRQRGETDARSLCTLQLIEALGSAHNDLLTALRATFEKKQLMATAAATSAVGLQLRSGAAAAEDADEARREHLRLVEEAEDIDDAAAEAEAEAAPLAETDASLQPLQVSDMLRLPTEGRPLTETAPTVDYRTPSSVVCSHLLAYDQSRDLLPLVYAFASDPGGESGDAHPPRYDFGAIERGLRRRILDGKRPINLVVGRAHGRARWMWGEEEGVKGCRVVFVSGNDNKDKSGICGETAAEPLVPSTLC